MAVTNLELHTIDIEEGVFVRKKFSQGISSAIFEGYVKMEGSNVTETKSLKIDKNTKIKVESITDYDRSSNVRGNGSQDYATLSIYIGEGVFFYYNDFIRNYEAFFIDNTNYKGNTGVGLIANSNITIRNTLEDVESLTKKSDKKLSLLEKKYKRSIWMYGHCRGYGKRKK